MPDVQVFIYGAMNYVGGIQSIIIRAVAAARAQGRMIFVVCDASKPAIGIPDDVVIDINASPRSISRRIMAACGGERARLTLAAMAPEAAALARLVQADLLRNSTSLVPRTALFIFHPRTLMMESDRPYVHVLNRLLIAATGHQFLVFMNSQCLISHQKFLGRDLSGNAIVPVPIDSRPRRWQGSVPGMPLRIVAVGRLVGFKAYNFGLPRLLAELRSKGIDVRCDIFGWGEMERDLVDMIAAHKAGDFVRFRGKLALDDFDRVVAGYDMFVGMGIAALQAAQLGVPTVLAIVDDPDGAHGYLFEVPHGNIGEVDDTIQRKDLSDLIEGFVVMDQGRRAQISERCEQAANRYVVDDYLSQVPDHSFCGGGTAGRLAMLYCSLHVWIFRDNFIRRLLRGARRLASGVV